MRKFRLMKASIFGAATLAIFISTSAHAGAFGNSVVTSRSDIIIGTMPLVKDVSTLE
jgi:hypothetical protein